MTRLLALMLISAAALLLYWVYDTSKWSSDSHAVQAANTAGDFSVPDVDGRPTIMVRPFASNIYDAICKLGHPFMVAGWDMDEYTRFLYFAGPFDDRPNDPDSPVYKYQYISIPGVDRTRTTTTLYMDSVNVDPADIHHDELERFLVPRITGIPDRPDQARSILGEPAAVRELSSGRTRMIFHRYLCMGDKSLAGMYLDIEDGVVVKAKGVEHPERMKWVVSGGRPPPPDPEPTYYTDMYLREPDAQGALFYFVRARENGDAEKAAKYLATGYFPFPELVERITADPHPDGTLEFTTATYQALKYQLDAMEIKVTYRLDTGLKIVAVYEMRLRDEEWKVSALLSEQAEVPD